MESCSFDNFENGSILRSLNEAVLHDPDSYVAWEPFVLEVERVEGGLNRNSAPESISLFRSVYDKFLAKFPLFFGFWKKYAQFEFTIGGTEASELVYERGLACIPMSTDLWTSYCAFKMETSHNIDAIREIFERGLEFVGLDFQGFSLWEQYLEFEERNEAPVRAFKILERAIQIPSSAYQRLFMRYYQLLQTVPLPEVAAPEVLEQLQSAIQGEAEPNFLTEYELDQRIRERLALSAREIYNKTEAETAKRDRFERGIKRSYFHVTELPEDELVNWRRYLDFEEVEGDYERIKILYERCLVSCALYDEFWLRYVRWMYAQPDKEEDVRLIYLRACCIYVPVSRPHIRLQYALFEEMAGRRDVADAVYDGMLCSLPRHIDTIIAWASFRRRHQGPDAAIDLLQNFVDDITNDVYVRGALVTEIARLTWKAKHSPEDAREIFEKNKTTYCDVKRFWVCYFKFETEHAGFVAVSTKNDPKAISEQIERVRRLVEDIQKNSRIPPTVIRDIVHLYQIFLFENSPIPVGKEYLDLDKEVNGPYSVQSINKSKLADDGKESTTTRRMLTENGHPGVSIDEASVRKGEDPYSKYYQQQGVPPDPPLVPAYPSQLGHGNLIHPTPAYTGYP